MYYLDRSGYSSTGPQKQGFCDKARGLYIKLGIALKTPGDMLNFHPCSIIWHLDVLYDFFYNIPSYIAAKRIFAVVVKLIH